MDLGALARGEAIWIAVEGRSMAPTLISGDEVLVRRIEAWPPQRGSVVLTLNRRGEFILHRVLRWTWHATITRGDAHRTADAETPRARVLGVAVRMRRDGVEKALTSRNRATLTRVRNRVVRALTSALRARAGERK